MLLFGGKLVSKLFFISAFIILSYNAIFAQSSSDYQRFIKNGKYGYKTTDGEIVLKPKYAYAGEFNEGRAIVASSNYNYLNYGIIDENFNEIIELEQTYIGDFSEGLAKVKVGSFKIFKDYFKEQAKDCVCPPQLPRCSCNHKSSIKILTKKVVKPSIEEINFNPRARSAKLRAVEKK